MLLRSHWGFKYKACESAEACGCRGLGLDVDSQSRTFPFDCLPMHRVDRHGNHRVQFQGGSADMTWMIWKKRLNEANDYQDLSGHWKNFQILSPVREFSMKQAGAVTVLLCAVFLSSCEVELCPLFFVVAAVFHKHHLRIQSLQLLGGEVSLEFDRHQHCVSCCVLLFTVWVLLTCALSRTSLWEVTCLSPCIERQSRWRSAGFAVWFLDGVLWAVWPTTMSGVIHSWGYCCDASFLQVILLP